MPEVVVAGTDELNYIFEEGLTYSILRIDQGIDGLVFTIDLPCVCSIPIKSLRLIGSIHKHPKVTWYQLYDDGNWIGMFLKTKEEAEVLAEGRKIIWKEYVYG